MSRQTHGENMKNNQSKSSHKEQVSQRRHVDLITALEAIESREKARLKVTIPHEVAEELEQFLKEKGLPERQGIPMLIRYGLSDESEEELAKLKSERQSQIGYLWGTYCTMKFRAYEYFMENKELTMKLQFLLSENRSLKMRLKKEGLQSYVLKHDWDDWDKVVVEDYYRKYVFMSRL